MLGLWWIVCDTNPHTQHSDHGPGTGGEQKRKRGEPLWCTEIIGFSHNLAICYLLKFPPLPCQDKSVNIPGTWAVQQRSGVLFLDGKCTESPGGSVFCLLRTMQWILSKLEFMLPVWSLIQLPREVQGVIVLYEAKAEMQHKVVCKKSFIRHKTQVLGNDFQSRF